MIWIVDDHDSWVFLQIDLFSGVNEKFEGRG